MAALSGTPGNGANLSWSAGQTIAIVHATSECRSSGRGRAESRHSPASPTPPTVSTTSSTTTSGYAIDGTTVTELDGETGPTYTATADDVTKDIQVRVIFDDDVRNREYPRYSPQVTVREVPPVVTGVTLTSDPNDDGITGNDGTYAIGDSVTATVTFDKAVDVTAGPQITLLVGTADKAADCAATTNTTTVECSYEVAANDTAPDGVGIKANTLALNGGTIYATGSTTNSGHAYPFGARPPVRPLGGRHTPDTGHDRQQFSPRTSGDGTEIILTFSEDINICRY